MANPALYSQLSPRGDEPRDLDQDVYDIGLMAGERSAPPPLRPSRRRPLRVIVLLLLAGGGGWAYLDGPSGWRDRIAQEWAAFNVAVERQAAAPAPSAPAAKALPAVEPTSQPMSTASIPAPVAPQPPAPIPEKVAPAVETPAAKPTVDASPATKEEAAPVPAEPLPEVVATEPYQRRAVAAGLHPELSRALLEKLSAADYRNASQAIRTALAETPDAEVLIWPQPPKRGLAVFQVRFVEGAPADCRRYVVAIGKDGWSTTALPMEKCGIKPRRSAARLAPATQGAGNKALVRPSSQ